MVLVNDKPQRLGAPVKYQGGVLAVPEHIMYLVDTPSSSTPTPSSVPGPRRVIVVDPGHGGDDLGARHSGVTEKSVNLSVARELAVELERRGYTARLTRDSDVFIPLEARTAFARKVHADLFISVHANSARNRQASGVEVFYPEGGGSAPAAVSVSPRPFTASSNPRPSAPVAAPNTAGYVVLRTSSCPAVLVEVGFLSHAPSREMLNTFGYRRDVARCIADGVDSFFRGEKVLMK